MLIYYRKICHIKIYNMQIQDYQYKKKTDSIESSLRVNLKEYFYPFFNINIRPVKIPTRAVFSIYKVITTKY